LSGGCQVSVVVRGLSWDCQGVVSDCQGLPGIRRLQGGCQGVAFIPASSAARRAFSAPSLSLCARPISSRSLAIIPCRVNVKGVVRVLSGCCQGVVRGLSGGCQGVVRVFSGCCQGVVFLPKEGNDRRGKLIVKGRVSGNLKVAQSSKVSKPTNRLFDKSQIIPNNRK